MRPRLQRSGRGVEVEIRGKKHARKRRSDAVLQTRKIRKEKKWRNRQDLLFSKEHEWVKLDGDSATIGITDYAQNSLGDIVYVELPKVGCDDRAVRNVGVIESVKAVSDLFTPMSGEVVEVNGELESDPAAVNREPYGAGWLLKMRLSKRRGSERPALCRPSTKKSLSK